MVVIKTSFVNLTVFQILFHLDFRFSVDLPPTNTHDGIVNSQGQTGYVKHINYDSFLRLFFFFFFKQIIVISHDSKIRKKHNPRDHEEEEMNARQQKKTIQQASSVLRMPEPRTMKHATP